VREILDRFKMKDCNSTVTPVEFGLKLHKDEEGENVDCTIYKQIGGNLLYLTATWPEIMYAVSLISRYIKNLTTMHMLAKRSLQYL